MLTLSFLRLTSDMPVSALDFSRSSSASALSLRKASDLSEVSTPAISSRLDRSVILALKLASSA